MQPQIKRSRRALAVVTNNALLLEHLNLFNFYLMKIMMNRLADLVYKFRENVHEYKLTI